MAPACSYLVSRVLWNESTEGWKRGLFSLHTEMGCVALPGLIAAAAAGVTDQGTHRDKILPPWHLMKDSPALCNGESGFILD